MHANSVIDFHSGLPINMGQCKTISGIRDEQNPAFAILPWRHVLEIAIRIKPNRMELSLNKLVGSVLPDRPATCYVTPLKLLLDERIDVTFSKFRPESLWSMQLKPNGF